LTKEEATKILAILKAAYPSSFKDLKKDDANAIVTLWAAQFSKIPAGVVMIAVNKIISTKSAFAPSIAEVKERIRGLYWEAWDLIDKHNRGFRRLDEKTLATTKEILKVVEPMRTEERVEPSMYELLGGYAQYLTDGKKQIE